ncbi:hypothetical protein EV356DRAFT_204434 [Viridothelium virens]|uniref:DUF676 domain-containing protein n=1 Tax=Viridothelium virens TaxID=1048519 RepID=A0A6A6H6R2_VIRVR|nr:hypothetical protein EV356DRAFT_204434 [Viridothelium virens]
MPLPILIRVVLVVKNGHSLPQSTCRHCTLHWIITLNRKSVNFLMDTSFHLVIVNGLTDTQSDISPKSFFSARFRQALIDEFFFFESSSTVEYSLDHRANLILADLLRSRKSYEEKHREDSPLPLIFVGHDLGGALIKQALLVATEKAWYRGIADRTLATLFFATPHRKFSARAWEYQLFGLIAASSLPPPLLLRDIHILSEKLEDLSFAFLTISCVFDLVNFWQSDGDDRVVCLSLYQTIHKSLYRI